MFSRNRERRYNELIRVGFRPFEGRWLSTIPFWKHPAMAHLIRKRRKLQERRIKEANRKGWSKAKRELVWNKRTKMLYQRRHWISLTDHPTHRGPAAGQPNPFDLYRHYERSEVNPMPGDSRKPVDHRSDADRRWQLDRGQIVLLRARQAKEQRDWGKYQFALTELDQIIANSSGKKREQLTIARNRIEKRYK
jgi:hypothetical protein